MPEKYAGNAKTTSFKIFRMDGSRWMGRCKTAAPSATRDKDETGPQSWYFASLQLGLFQDRAEDQLQAGSKMRRDLEADMLFLCYESCCTTCYIKSIGSWYRPKLLLALFEFMLWFQKCLCTDVVKQLLVVVGSFICEWLVDANTIWYISSNVSAITEGQIGQESYKVSNKWFLFQQTEFSFSTEEMNQTKFLECIQNPWFWSHLDLYRNIMNGHVFLIFDILAGRGLGNSRDRWHTR